MAVVVVYVHLGQVKPTTLLAFADLNKKFNPEVDFLLLTDEPRLFTGFPGSVVDISKFQRTLLPWSFRLFHYDRLHIARGYWKNTLSRLFALELIDSVGLASSDCLIIHIESDVLLFSHPNFLVELERHIKHTSVTRLSQNLGIGAIVVSPNRSQLAADLRRLKGTLTKKISWVDDMTLLGQALNLGILHALEDIPLRSGDQTLEVIAFDGWPAGQYLFGLDPIHTNGTARGGYLSPFLPFNPKAGEWNIKKLDKDSPSEILMYREGRYVRNFFNLHIHSKVLVPTVDSKSKLWIQTLSAANGKGKFPEFVGNPSKVIHSDNGSFPARLMRKVKAMIFRWKTK